MRNVIFGVIGVLWGGYILMGSCLGGMRGGGAYGAGQMVGTLFGLLLFVAGLSALGGSLFGLIQSSAEQRPRPRRRKRRRRPVREEDEDDD